MNSSQTSTEAQHRRRWNQGFQAVLAVLAMLLPSTVWALDKPTDDKPLPKPAAAGLPVFQPALTYQMNKALAPGEFARSFSYNGANPLFGNGTMGLRYSQGLALFGPMAGSDQAAWALEWKSAPTQKGFTASLLSSATPDHAGSAAGPFAADELGLRRTDLRLGWQDGARSFAYARDRVGALANGAGFGRDSLSAGLKGFTWQRERLSFDADMAFNAANTANLLGAKGYNLAARTLGSATSGFTALGGLAGLRDEFEQMGYRSGKVELRQWDRTLSREGQSLHDFGQSAKLGRFAFSRAARSVSGGFAPLQQAGYAHWARLKGGREDELAASYTGTNWAAGWNQTLTSLGQGDSAAVTRSTVYNLRVAPAKGLSLAGSHTSRVSGSAALLAAEDRKQVNQETLDAVEASYKTGAHSFAGSFNTSFGEQGATRRSSRAWELNYGHGARTRVSWRERNTANAVTAADGTVSLTPTWMQRVSVDTAMGLSWVREKTSGGGQTGRYEAWKLSQKPTRATSMKAVWERWRNAAAPGFAIAGRGGLLDAPLPRAQAWTLAGSWKPGKAQIDAQWRQLDWKQDGEARGFTAGEHSVAEYSVGVTQPLGPTLGVHAEWNRLQMGNDQNRERRELTLQYKPSQNPLIPLAEAGVRQVVVDAEHSTLAPFARLKMTPLNGTSLEAALAQSAIDQAQTRDALTWSKQQNSALKLSASQKMGLDGLLKVEYATQPRTPAKAVELWEQGPIARTMAVELNSPTNLLAAGLQVKGRWERQNEPAIGSNEASQQDTYRAGLTWKGQAGDELTVSYWMQAREQGVAERQQQRMDVSYTADLGEAGKLSVTGYWNADSDAAAMAEKPEAYRVGLMYNAEF